MAVRTEMIINVDAPRRAWPPWLRFVVGIWIPTWLGVMTFGFTLRTDGSDGFLIFWGAYLFLFALAVWGASITWVQVGPDWVVVRRPMRSQVVAMSELLEVDAHRDRWSVRARGQPPLHRIYLTMTRGRRRLVDGLEPDAGDRLLAEFHRLGKPIRLFPTR